MANYINKIIGEFFVLMKKKFSKEFCINGKKSTKNAFFFFFHIRKIQERIK